MTTVSLERRNRCPATSGMMPSACAHPHMIAATAPSSSSDKAKGEVDNSGSAAHRPLRSAQERGAWMNKTGVMWGEGSRCCGVLWHDQPSFPSHRRAACALMMAAHRVDALDHFYVSATNRRGPQRERQVDHVILDLHIQDGGADSPPAKGIRTRPSWRRSRRR